MSGNLEWNKIFGAGLATVFTILVVQQASGFVYATKAPEKMGYAVDIPEEGDFEYEFDVEVRPEFELPEYHGLKIERPTHEVSEEDAENHLQQFLLQYVYRAQ